MRKILGSEPQCLSARMAAVAVVVAAAVDAVVVVVALAAAAAAWHTSMSARC